jgi:hypothetical protein
MEKRFFNSLVRGHRAREEIFIAHIYRRNAEREEKKPATRCWKKKFHYEFHREISRLLRAEEKYFDILIIDLCACPRDRRADGTQCDNLIEAGSERARAAHFVEQMKTEKCLIHLNNLLIHTFSSPAPAWPGPKHTLTLAEVFYGLAGDLFGPRMPRTITRWAEAKRAFSRAVLSHIPFLCGSLASRSKAKNAICYVHRCKLSVN